MFRKLSYDFQLVFSFTLPVLLVIFGTVGYMIIERWTLLDSLYMTLITVATVGYGEIHHMSTSGRIFTSILIVSGVVIIAYCIQTFVMYMLQKNIFGTFWRRAMDRQISRLKNHVILCGYGKIGRHVAEEFTAAGTPFVLIDADLPDEETLRDKKVLFINGDATDEHILKEAGIDHARALVTVVGKDADNMFITMTARSLVPSLTIVARAEEASNKGKLLRAGADKVVLPYELGGRRIASQVLYPSVANFLETVMSHGSMELRMAEITVAEKSSLDGKTLQEADIRKKTGSVILAIRKTDNRLFNNPPSDTMIRKGDMFICLGTQEQIQSLQKLAGE